MTKCISCLEEKDDIFFNKNSKRKTGCGVKCKDCMYRDMRITVAAYQQKNKEHLRKKAKEYQAKNKEKLVIWKKNSDQNVRNDPQRLARRAEYKAKWHKEKMAKRTPKPQKAPMTRDLLKISACLRQRVRYCLKAKGGYKRGETLKLLGASVADVKKHIERQFKKGMTWENHGKGIDCWHIDHKIPLSSAKTAEELITLCHYRNLQPLWAIENSIKHDKILPFQAYLAI